MAVNIDKQLLGGLNSDVNIQNVAPTDYLDALNITAKRRQAEAGEDIYPLLGEEYPFSQGPNFSQTDIVQSGRLVRILLPTQLDPANYPAVVLGVFIVRNENGTPITPLGPGIIGGTTWGAVDLAWQGYVSGLAAHVGSTASFANITDNSEYFGYIDVRITNMGAYTIEFSSSYPQYNIPIQVVEDVISTNFFARGGVAKMIGSCRDARGTYIFTTPKPDVNLGNILPSIVAVTNTVDITICSNTILTFAAPHGLNLYERISIVGCTDALHINGLWQVFIISDTEVALISSDLSIFVPGTGTGANATFLYDTIGSIGYIESNIGILGGLGGIENNFGANFTELITTTAFDFTHEHPIDATAKYNNYNSIVKWTDDYSKPKMMVYNGYPLVAGGYIFGPNNWNAQYYLESIAITSNLQVSDQNFRLTVSQTTGGVLDARNYIYLVAGETFDGAVSTYSLPSMPILVLAKDAVDVPASVSWQYTGSTFGAVTNKANVVNIDNIPAGIYDRLKVIAINYTPSALGGFVQFATINLTPTQTRATITHFGNETTIPVSQEEILALYPSISKALNISELLNTTILSNLTYEVDENLYPVVDAIQYQVRYVNLPGPGYGPVPAVLTDAFPLGEYANPTQQPTNMSFMPLETVRCGVMFKRKGGGWTKVYHIEDIRIDDSPVAGKRVGTLPSYRCNIGDMITISFENLDWNYVLPSGKKLKEVYEDARFVRAEITPQTLLTGLAFTSCEIAGFNYLDSIIINPATPMPGGVNRANARRRLYFMTFDGMNNTNFPFVGRPGLKLICFGTPIVNSRAATSYPNSSLLEYSSWQSDSANYGIYDITEIENLSQNSPVQVGSAQMVGQDANGVIGGVYQYQSPLAARIYGIEIPTNITNDTSVGNPDIQIYSCFVYDPTVDAYPVNPADSKYYDMGYVPVNPDADTLLTQYIVRAGGNAYAQNTYMGFRVVRNSATGVQEYFAGIGFRTYNKGNAQSMARVFPGGYAGIPLSLQDSINSFVNVAAVVESSGNYLTYSQAFTKRNVLPALAGFDPQAREAENAQATIAWSLPSIENSEWNNDRVFLPLNRRDLDLTFGPIWGSFVLNKILITVQTDYIERQYFDNTGYLISSSAPAILGTGDTMGRRGDAITMIGSSNKWSMFLGMSNSGNQFLYGVDAKRFKFWRVGADGTTILSDQYKIDFLSKKNLTLAKFFNNPIKNQGLTGVYDIKNEAAIFTSVICNKSSNTPAWLDGNSYDPGKLVIDENCYYSYEEIPVIFRCIQSHVSTPLDRPRLSNSVSKQYWETIPYTNTDFYNVFTLVFYEDRNVFKTFLSYYHSHMAGFEDTFVVLPNSNRFSRILENVTIDIIDVDPPIVVNTVNLIISSTALLGPGVSIYITSFPGTTNMLGYYQYSPSILGPGFYGIVSPTLISINCYNTPTAPGPITTGTIVLAYGTSLAPASSLYVHRELSQVLRWYPKIYTIPCSSYTYTAGDTQVFVGAQLASIIENSDFWQNMVLVFNFNTQIREATKVTEDTIYFSEPLISSGTLTDLVFEMYLSKDGYITPVINENKGSLVKFCNFRFNSLIAPQRVDLNTQVHESYLETSDFVSYDTIHDAPIKMDTTGGFTPDTGESVLFGKFMKVKITFKKLTEQFIHKFGTGIRLMSSEKKRRT